MKTPAEDSRSLNDLYIYGKELLSDAGVEEADTDAHILLEYAAGIDRSRYYLHMDEPAGEKETGLYMQLLHRRAKREPVQYLTGEAPFFGNVFCVTPDVLIPRQDTEVLVLEAGKRLLPGMHILDLCTGSGCVLLSLLKMYSVTGTGADISKAALKVAEKNRQRMQLEASWIESDLFVQIKGRFDLITANPPYIAENVLSGLQPEVAGHEPRLALDGGRDGLEILRRIISRAPQHLKSGGWLLTEIGFDQGDAVRQLLQEQHFEETVIIRDLGNRDRVAAGRRP